MFEAVPDVRVDYPGWLYPLVRWSGSYPDDASRMRLAISLSRENVLQKTGGPFGAAIFQRESGRLVAVGVNSVVRLKNSTLHAEMLAFMMAQARVASYTLGAVGMPAHELFTSCEPCAMCLGGALWSGVRRVVFAAGRDDALKLDFEEGPVFPESYAYLEARGVHVEGGFLREEANAVLELYRTSGGEIYNG